MTYEKIAAVAVAAGTILAATVAFADADDSGRDSRTRRECRANGAEDISMSARFETRGGAGGRRKFSVEFEAGPGTGFPEGKRIQISVQDVVVGATRLERLAGGDTVGDLNFDTKPQPDADPFPADFPSGVGRGTVVNVLHGGNVVLGCTLK